ncbi:hypothetical protein QOZ80_8AG0630750 [Eleusine coracana subsp. coracana]|nr:hypothetical protein QOZ80_8AG0630750 [Eleusine coracana subsp. coracana]
MRGLRVPLLISDDDDAAAEYPPWVLLESEAYVAKRENSTTAFSKTWGNKDIQVTVFPRRPPRLSYLCVYSDGEIPVEPQILAMEEDIIVLRITVSCQKDFMENIDYYVYQAADGAAGWRPSLTLLERPPWPLNSFYPEQTGVVLHETSHKQADLYMRPHSHGERSYLIAALKALHWEVHKDFPPGTFMLCLYNSKKGSWSFSTVSLNQQQVHWKKSVMCKGQWYEDEWVAATWARPANCFTGSWCKEQVVDTKTMNFKNNPYLKLLPKVRSDEDMVLPPFKRISACQPIFGDDSILYLMAKFSRQDDNGWIVAVDMNSKVADRCCPIYRSKNQIHTLLLHS